MSFGFKKVQTLSFVLIVIASQTASCSVAELSSALTTLQTKLGELIHALTPKKPQNIKEFTQQALEELNKTNKEKDIFNQLLAIDPYALDQKLGWCLCHTAPKDLRYMAILKQLVIINQQFSDKTQSYTHTEFAEFECGHLYILAVGLMLLGFKNINLVVIGDVKTLKDYASKLKKALDDKANKLKINATISVAAFAGPKWKKEYNKQTHASHSYGLTDPSVTVARQAIVEFYELIEKNYKSPSHPQNPLIFVLNNNNFWMLDKLEQLPVLFFGVGLTTSVHSHTLINTFTKEYTTVTGQPLSIIFPFTPKQIKQGKFFIEHHSQKLAEEAGEEQEELIKQTIQQLSKKLEHIKQGVVALLFKKLDEHHAEKVRAQEEALREKERQREQKRAEKEKRKQEAVGAFMFCDQEEEQEEVAPTRVYEDDPEMLAMEKLSMLAQLDRIIKKYPKKNKQLIYTEFLNHADRLMHLFLVIHGLVDFGYQNIHVNVVLESPYKTLFGKPKKPEFANESTKSLVNQLQTLSKEKNVTITTTVIQFDDFIKSDAETIHSSIYSIASSGANPHFYKGLLHSIRSTSQPLIFELFKEYGIYLAGQEDLYRIYIPATPADYLVFHYRYAHRAKENTKEIIVEKTFSEALRQQALEDHEHNFKPYEEEEVEGL